MENNMNQANQKDVTVYRNLRLSATITMILGFLAVLSIILLVLALSDIADSIENLKLEWFTCGISIVILGIFIVSTFIMVGLLMKIGEIWRKADNKN